MSTVTMTMYEALAKKKMLEKKVDSMKVDTVVTRATEVSNEINGIDIDSYKAKLQSNYDSAVHTMANLAAIKAAINQSNSTTRITVADHEYTVTEAITRYNNIPNELVMYRNMVNQYNNVVNAINEWNERNLAPDVVSEYISRVLGDSKKDEAIINSTRENYFKNNRQTIIDPVGVGEKAVQKIEEIEQFKEEIHFKLSNSNVTTLITVDFED